MKAGLIRGLMANIGRGAKPPQPNTTAEIPHGIKVIRDLPKDTFRRLPETVALTSRTSAPITAETMAAFTKKLTSEDYKEALLSIEGTNQEQLLEFFTQENEKGSRLLDIIAHKDDNATLKKALALLKGQPKALGELLSKPGRINGYLSIELMESNPDGIKMLISAAEGNDRVLYSMLSKSLEALHKTSVIKVIKPTVKRLQKSKALTTLEKGELARKMMNSEKANSNRVSKWHGGF